MHVITRRPGQNNIKLLTFFFSHFQVYIIFVIH